jgi:hypothetical protein
VARKGKRQKAKIKRQMEESKGASALEGKMSSFLPFDFCLLPFAFRLCL